MALHRSSCFLSLLLLPILTCIARAEELPETMLCADNQCKEEIGEGITTQIFSPGDSFKLSFAPNQKVTIYSKSDGGSQGVLRVEINGRAGFAPARLIKEVRSFRDRKNLVRVKVSEVYGVNNDSTSKQDQLPQATPPPAVLPSLVSNISASPTDVSRVQPSPSNTASLGGPTDAPTPIKDVVQSCTLDGTVIHGENCEGEGTEVPPVDASISSPFHPQYVPSGQSFKTVDPDYMHIEEPRKTEEKASVEVEKTESLVPEKLKDAAAPPNGSEEGPRGQEKEVTLQSKSPGNKTGDGFFGDFVSGEKEKGPYEEAGQKEKRKTHVLEEQGTVQLGNESTEPRTSSEHHHEIFSKETDADSENVSDDIGENIPGEDDEEDNAEDNEVEVKGKEEDVPESLVKQSVKDPVPPSGASGPDTSEKAGNSTEGTESVSVGKEEQPVTKKTGGTVSDVPEVGKNVSEVGAAPPAKHVQQPVDDSFTEVSPTTALVGDGLDDSRSTPVEASGVEKLSSESGTSAPGVIVSDRELSLSELRHQQVGVSADSSSPLQLLDATGAANQEPSPGSGSVQISTPSATTELISTAGGAITDGSGEPMLDAVASLNVHSSLSSTMQGHTSTHDIPRSAEFGQSGASEGGSSPLLHPSTTGVSVEGHTPATPSLDSSLGGSVQTSGVTLFGITTEPSADASTAIDDSSSVDTVAHNTGPCDVKDNKDDATTTGPCYERRSLFSVSSHQEEDTGVLASPVPMPLALESNGGSVPNARPFQDGPSDTAEVSESVDEMAATSTIQTSGVKLFSITTDPSADASTAIDDSSPVDSVTHNTSPSDVEDSKDDAMTTGLLYERRSLFSVSSHQEEDTGVPASPLPMPLSLESSGGSIANVRTFQDGPSDTVEVSESVDEIAATSTMSDTDSVAYGVHKSDRAPLSGDGIETQHETGEDVPEEDFVVYVQLYFNMVKEYIQFTVDMLPDPLHAALLDLGINGPSPRVAVFTFLSGVFGFVLLISYSCFVNRRKEASLMAAVASLEQKLFTVLTERDVLREEVEQAKGQGANTYKNLLEKQDVVRKLQKENKELERSNQQLEAALHKVKEAWTQDRDQLGSLRSELCQKEAEIAELGDALDRERGEKGRTYTELQKREGLIAEERTKVEQLKSNEKRLRTELAELQAARETLLKEQELCNNRIAELSSKSELDAQEINKLFASLHDRDAENQVLQDNIKQLTVLQEMCGRTEDDTTDGCHSKELEICLNRLMDVGQMRLEYQKVKEQNDLLEEQLGAERRHLEKKREDLEKLEEEMERLKRDTREAQRERTEAVTKLEILSSYFKDREVQLQKEIGLQEALRCQKDVDASSATQQLALLEQQNSSYKSQLSSLKQEMEVSERNYKNQITDQEKRAHENWLAARGAERKLEEANKELASLRQRLTFVQREKDRQVQSAFTNNHTVKQSLASSDDLSVEAPPLPPLHPLYLPPPPFVGDAFPSRPPEPWMLPGGILPPPPPEFMFKRHRGSPGPFARASPGSSLRDDSPPHSRGSPPLPRLPHLYDPHGGPSPPLGPFGPPPFLGPHGFPPPLGPMGPPLGPGPAGLGSRGPRGHHRSSNSASDGRSSANSTTRPSPQPLQNTRSSNGPAAEV